MYGITCSLGKACTYLQQLPSRFTASRPTSAAQGRAISMLDHRARLADGFFTETTNGVGVLRVSFDRDKQFFN
jgi:hypothetical protein